MAYIGVQPADAYTSFAVQHFTTSATTSYTLDNPVANENEIALFINNVRQEPGSAYAYTASGTALTLSAATSASDTMYCVFIGKAVQTVTPASGSVTGDMMSYPLTNFSSTGIDDNATSTAITINSLERVGIGTSSPDRSLHINTPSTQLKLQDSGATDSFFEIVDSAGIVYMGSRNNTNNGNFVFRGLNSGGASEYLRITSEGLHLGGTGSANALDDYEEGTWTPTIANMSVSGTFSASGRYVKVGRMVLAYGTFSATGSIAYDGSGLIGSFPFQGAVTDNGTATYVSLSGNSASGGIGLGDFVSSRFFFKDDFTTTGANQKTTFHAVYEANS